MSLSFSHLPNSLHCILSPRASSEKPPIHNLQTTRRLLKHFLNFTLFLSLCAFLPRTHTSRIPERLINTQYQIHSLPFQPPKREIDPHRIGRFMCPSEFLDRLRAR